MIRVLTKYKVPKIWILLCYKACEYVNYLKAKQGIRSTCIARGMDNNHQKIANKQITVVEIMCGPRKDISTQKDIRQSRGEVERQSFYRKK